MPQKSDDSELAGIPPDYLSDPLKRLGSDYVWVKAAGEGKNGIAHRLDSKSGGMSFCLKTVKPGLPNAERDKISETLRKEVLILKPLRHKCLPSIFVDQTHDETQPFYVSQFHHGQTFYDFIRSDVELSFPDLLYLVSLIVDVLSYLHDNGRTHCDLHPKNILVSPNLRQDGILLIDFGSGHRDTETSPQTVAGGTIHLKPEEHQRKYKQRVSRFQASKAFQKTDIKALGQLLVSIPERFLSSATETQVEAYYDFCNCLDGGAFSSWKEIQGALELLHDPFKSLSEVNRLFKIGTFDSHEITLPVHGGVPVGEAPLAVINHFHFQNLRRIPQLSFCDWHFPGARHTRFEHSLGVFELCRQAIEALSRDYGFRQRYEGQRLRGLLLAALLHDVGHYPFAHAIEQFVAGRFHGEQEVKDAVSHSKRSISILKERDFAKLIDSGWGTEARLSAIEILDGKHGMLAKIIDSAIDCDKLDYLPRDSLHSGMSFGNGLDIHGLINGLCEIDDYSDIGFYERCIASAEGFLILQDQMLSSVYWHPVSRAVICQFHALLALIFKNNKAGLLDCVEQIQNSSSEEKALDIIRVFATRLAEKGQTSSVSKIDKGRLDGIEDLLRFFVSGKYDDIFIPLIEFRNSDERDKGRIVPIFRSIVKTTDQTASLSEMPIEWSSVSKLRKAFKDAIETTGASVGLHEVLVDVPYGKTSHRRIKIKGLDGKTRHLEEISHLKESIFEAPTVHLSPLRVFVSPRLMKMISGRKAEMIEIAKTKFYDSREEVEV